MREILKTLGLFALFLLVTGILFCLYVASGWLLWIYSGQWLRSLIWMSGVFTLIAGSVFALYKCAYEPLRRVLWAG